MSSKSARMGQLADLMAVELNQPPAGPQETDKGTPKSTKAVLIKNKSVKMVAETLPLGKIELNPPHGEKDGFERMSITLPPEIRQRLLDESNRRKKERSPDWSISVIVREALAAHLK
jgi:hypothetical protein